jgi:2-oxoglutarate dehydrogenase E2 component (dihydrolipoamide succinyltransferase)
MADITMPQLGETVTEGTITRWTKAVGDQIAEDEVLYEVSTDKVDSEVPSPSSGYVAEILVSEGETVAVGTVLARISSAAPGGNGAAPAPPANPEPASAEAEPAEAEPEAEAPTSVEARDVQSDGAPTEAAPAELPKAGAPGSGGALLSPVVRRLIAEHDLDPAQISGTGVGGRITRNDVLKLVDGGGGGSAKPPPAPAPAAKAPAPAPAASEPAPAAPRPTPFPSAQAGERDEVIPFTRIRRATAEHMVRSKATSAHTMVAVEVDYLGVEKVRKAKKDAFKAEEGVGLTYLPFVARAVIDALADYPHVNSSVGDDELIVHRYVDLGIAVDLGFEGLLVPVIRDAHEKRLRPIARQVGDLAAKARTKRLSPDDLVGGTFTLTNAGPFGTFLTIPVISQPQTAILSTDGVKKKPVAVTLPDGSDGIAVHPVGILALSFDHRAFDGAYAAAFVARVKEILETRDWSTEI